MTNPRSSRPTPPGHGSQGWGAGAAVLAVLCCAAPALIAAGALGAVGAWLASPWVVGIAVALAGLALFVLVRRTKG
jgi:mercuric ion transport protein